VKQVTELVVCTNCTILVALGQSGFTIMFPYEFPYKRSTETH
jgi:hypothetical protein